MKKLPFLFATVLCLSSALFGDAPPPGFITLDSVMDTALQQKSGVAYLTRDQKTLIENWINDTFILKPKEQTSNPQGLSLSININSGQQLQLNDGTIWDVSPQDISTAAFWITPFPLSLTPSADPDYPMLITNLNTNVKVRVRKAATSS